MLIKLRVMVSIKALLTIRTRHSPRPARRTNANWIRAVGKSEPIRCIWLEVRSLNLDSEVDIIACESLTRGYRTAGQILIRKDGKGYADRNRLVWNGIWTCRIGVFDNRNRYCTCPKEDRGIKGIPTSDYKMCLTTD